MINYHFFLKGPFSQWYPSKFSIQSHNYKNAEQYMMWAKATLFDDKEIAERILSESNPKIQKQLGRQVREFNQQIWDKYKEKIVFKGNLEKFRQNSNLKKYLLDTGDAILVECNPVDFIWGIGLTESDARKCHPSQWRGQNLLGKILTRVKSVLRTNKV